MKKTKIGFLFDKYNNWIEKFINSNTIKNKKYIYDFKVNQKDSKRFGILFILGYTKFIKETFLKKNKYNLIIHESSLPKGKGFSPVQWQIINGSNKIPVSLIIASNKLDSGDIILKSCINLKGTELLDEIRYKQAQVTIKLINKILKIYPNIPLKKQTGKSTYFRKRTNKDNELNIRKSILSQINILRVSDNKKYPAHFNYRKQRYKIKIERD